MPTLENDKIDELKLEIHSDWVVIDYHHLKREFKFDNFQKALTS